MLSAIVDTSDPNVCHRLATLGSINVLLDLFFQFPNNNLFQLHVSNIIDSIFSSDIRVVQPLLASLLADSPCSILQCICSGWRLASVNWRFRGYINKFFVFTEMLTTCPPPFCFCSPSTFSFFILLIHLVDTWATSRAWLNRSSSLILRKFPRST